MSTINKSTINKMLDEYAESHQNASNQIIHKFCVPTIMFSIVGLLWAIPTPGSFPTWLNFGTALCIFSMVYYLYLSLKYFLVMIPIVALMVVGNYYLAMTSYLLSASVIVFVVSWAFQFWGHKIEAKKPSFFKDLLFLLIGPLWVAKKLLNLS